MNRKRQFGIVLLLIAAAIVCVAVAPTPALAGSYKVYSCKTPSGSAAPTDGWSATGHAPFSSFSNDCTAGGSMRVVLGGLSQTVGASNVGWGFDSGGMRIVDYTIHRSGTSTATGNGTSGLLYSARQLNDPGGSRAVDYCATYLGCRAVGNPAAGASSPNRLHQSSAQLPADISAWFITFGCGGYVGFPCSPLTGHSTHGSVYVHAAEFTLADDESPSAVDVQGDLATRSTLSGDATVGFVARDAQSGIFRAMIEIDGAEQVSVTPNDYAGRCVRLGQAGAINDFLHRKPCPANQPVELTLPTETIADGPHRLRVRVHDAAGNAMTVVGPKQIHIENQPASLNASASARFESDTPTRFQTLYGKRRAIAGRLVDRAGGPLANDRVEVFERLSSAGASRKQVATIETDRLGRYLYRPPATASRLVELVHQPSGSSHSTAQIVKSRILLRAFRSNVPAYGRLVLRGRIRSERSLRRVTVEIQARVGRRWQTVGVRRATVGGAFIYRYRLKRTANAKFRFRARVRRTSDLPVIPQPSRTVGVRVG